MFRYKGIRYKIISSEYVPSIGDIDLRKQIIYIDRKIHPKYHEGIAIHEITERKWLCKGVSNTAAHAKANLSEFKHYCSKMGKKAAKFMYEEELSTCRTKKPNMDYPHKSTPSGTVIYCARKWRIKSGHEERTGADISPTRSIVWINARVPTRFHTTLAVYTITERQLSETGVRYLYADSKAWHIAEVRSTTRTVKSLKKWLSGFYAWGLYRHRLRLEQMNYESAIKLLTSKWSR